MMDIRADQTELQTHLPERNNDLLCIVSEIQQAADEDSNLLNLTQDVAVRCRKILSEGHFDDKTRLAEVLGTAARQEKFRTWIGEKRILQAVLVLLKGESYDFELIRQLLRIIANSVADTEVNRRILVDESGLLTLLRLLRTSPDLRAYVLIAIYNSCVDYVPAQEFLIKHDGFLALFEVLSHAASDYDNIVSQDIYHGTKLVEMLLSQENSNSYCSEDAIFTIIQLFDADDFEIYLAALNSSMMLLELSKFKNIVLESSLLTSFLDVLEKSYQKTAEYIAESLLNEDEAKEVENRVQQARNMLVDKVCAISTLDEFLQHYPLTSSTIRRLEDWLQAIHKDLVICAAIVLGNAARSDKTCRTFVYEHKVTKKLVNTFKKADMVGVLHALAGLLRNLAITSIDIKENIGSSGGIEACDKLLKQDQLPQIHYIGLSLLRVLLAGAGGNIKRLFISASEIGKDVINSMRVTNMVNLFRATDDMPVRTEISRIITSILRFVSSSQGVLTAQLLECHEDIAQPLAFMVRQAKWPAIRSEGWFALALMARTELGAQRIAHTIKDMEFLEILLLGLQRFDEFEISASQSIPIVQDSKEGKMNDVDNATIFMLELSRNLPLREDKLKVVMNYLCNSRPINEFRSELLEVFSPAERTVSDMHVSTTVESIDL